MRSEPAASIAETASDRCRKFFTVMRTVYNECDTIPRMTSRRQFMRFVAQSPLLAAAAQETPAVIANPRDAIDVLDFEPAARKALPPAHYGYLATGVDDDATLRANREGFQRFQIRPRRVVDVSQHADMSVDLFGTKYETPILLAPVGSQNAFY